MRSAIVTGGQGFVGRHLVQTLRQHDVDVWTIGRRPSADPAEAGHIVLPEEGWATDRLGRIVKDIDPDCIFHLAGATRGTAAELMVANAGLFQTLLQALRQNDLWPRLVVAGSAAEYGSAIRDGQPVRETETCAPISAYGISKSVQTREALAYAAANGASVLLARIFNPVGSSMPRHLALGDFAEQIVAMRGRHGTLHVGNIDVRRDMMDVEHVAMLLYQLAVRPQACGVVNVCSGEAALLRDLVEMLIKGSGREIDIQVDRSRVRGNEPHTIVGSAELLAKLGCPPPPTDHAAVIARICRDIDDRRARQHDQASMPP